MRKGFGILTAIIIMMSVAILMSLAIGLSTSTIKQTSDLYLKQQAELLLRSATEFSLLAISGHNNNNSCVESVHINQGVFQADVDIWYIGKNLPSSCSHIIANNLVTDDSQLSAILDVVVYTNVSNEPIRLHRRTIQKP